jgi:hypothetical protein
MDHDGELFVTAEDFTEVRSGSGKNFDLGPVSAEYVCRVFGTAR